MLSRVNSSLNPSAPTRSEVNVGIEKSMKCLRVKRRSTDNIVGIAIHICRTAGVKRDIWQRRIRAIIFSSLISAVVYMVLSGLAANCRTLLCFHFYNKLFPVFLTLSHIRIFCQRCVRNHCLTLRWFSLFAVIWISISRRGLHVSFDCIRGGEEADNLCQPCIFAVLLHSCVNKRDAKPPPEDRTDKLWVRNEDRV